MISAVAHQFDLDAARSCGADRYLPKPVSPRRLVAELRDLIAERGTSGR